MPVLAPEHYLWMQKQRDKLIVSLSKMNNDLIFKLSKVNKFFKNKFSKDTSYWKIGTVNPCGDHFSVSFETLDPYIKGISSKHEGCLLSKAVANAILLEIENKPKPVAINLLQNFLSLGEKPSQNICLSQNLMIFEKFAKFPSRKKCLFSVAKVIMDVLNEK